MSASRLRARADRVNEACDLGVLLQEYGYAIVPDRQREQQFSCDLHGVDAKPSARYYGVNNTTYCWVCQKSRDPIAYVMEKEHVGFREAIEFLEKKLGLKTLPWSDEHKRPKDVRDEIDEIVAENGGYEKEREKLRGRLQMLTNDRDLDLTSLLSFWEVFDRIDYGVAREGWGEEKGSTAMLRLRERVIERLEKEP